MQGTRFSSGERLHLRKTEVPFIEHVTSDEGSSVDAAKTRAIIELPKPTDQASLQRLLAMFQYLSKFLPYLSEITKHLVI